VNAVKLYPGGLTAWLLQNLNTYPLSGTIEERIVKDSITGLPANFIVVTMKGSDINCELACDDILISEKWSCELQSKRSMSPPKQSESKTAMVQMFKIIPSANQFPNKKVLSLVSTSETSSNFDLFRSCLQTETSMYDGPDTSAGDQNVEINKSFWGELEYSITEVSSVESSTTETDGNAELITSSPRVGELLYPMLNM
jgi:hypothetical protein